jgi:hypothetical protein
MITEVFILLIMSIMVFMVKNILWSSYWMPSSPMDYARKNLSIVFFYGSIIGVCNIVFLSEIPSVDSIKWIFGLSVLFFLTFVITFLVKKIKNNFQKTTIKSEYWERALKEFEENTVDRGVLAQSISEANGDDSKIKSTYIRLRAENLSINSDNRD